MRRCAANLVRSHRRIRLREILLAHLSAQRFDIKVKMAVFTLPKVRDLLKYHTRWNDQALNPYIEDLIDLWAENDIYGVLDVCMQGPMLTRFGIKPDDMKSASRIMNLEKAYRYMFRRKDVRVYRSDGRIYIDVPWQRDPVWLGDLLTSREFESSQGLPLAIGMNIYRECVLHELTEVPHLLVGGNPSSGLDEFLVGLLLSILVHRTPDEIELFLCSSGILGFEDYARLPYCHVISSVRNTMAMLSEMSREIDRRISLLTGARCRNIFQYNEQGGNLRHRVIMITEYHRLFTSNKQAAMAYILRMAELAGPCGIHLILASSDPACLRGLGDSFPARVCLKVSTPQDSHALLNQKGGESLPRKGSLYYLDGIDPDPQYLQCGFISQREIRSVIDALASNYVNIRKRSIFEEIEDDDPEYGASESGKKKSRRPHQS